MATPEQLQAALINADKAGDVEAATALATELKRVRQPAAVEAGSMLKDIPRQVGLTARYALEGPATAAQIVTEPIRAITDRLFGFTGKTAPLGAMASQFADKLGLPQPADANERVVGDATRLGFGALLPGAIANRAATPASDLLQFGGRNAEPIAQTISQKGVQALGSNVTQQVSSAAGAGLAGGAVREAGGSPVEQGVASLVGGVASGMVPDAAKSAVNGARTFFNRPNQQQLDQQISILLQRADVDYSALPGAARNALRQDLVNALRAGQELDPRAVRRLADFRAVGATPTRGMVSQNPVQITREMNLAKIGANSSDDGLQGLALLQNRNNGALIRNLNDQGASRGNLQTAGETVNNAVLGRQADLRGAERAAWTEARNSPSYTQPIYPDGLNNINRSLGDEGMMGFLNPQISRYMEAFQTGQQPFTPQAYRNLQSMLSNELARGGNEAAAARIARNALEGTPIQPITAPVNPGNLPLTGEMAQRLRAMDAGAGQSVDAINRARAATRTAYAYEESSPLVRNVLSEGASGDPMRIARRYVVGGTPNEAATLAQEVGQSGRGPIRDAIVAHLKEKALNGAADEVGKFSQSAYNKTLREIGEQKLALFFSPEEIAQLNAVGRVASYAQVQPAGSAVNNSNSGALAVAKAYDTLMGLANRIPVIGPNLVPPIRNIEVSIANRQAQNVIPGLLAPVERHPVGSGLLLPGIAAGGLLAAPTQ